jgi:hypothetical protein
MLEDLIRVGAPSFLPDAKLIVGGTGGFCSQGVIDGFLKGQNKYLPFVANGINSVATQGQDVVSGPFSGCVMAAYTEGGARKVCHVSTGADYGDCKPAWDTAKAGYANVVEFKPSDYIGKTPYKYCYGLITANGGKYVILVQTKSLPHPEGGSLVSDPLFVKFVKAG